MLRRSVVILVIVIFFSLILGLHLSALRSSYGQQDSSDPLMKMEAKIDKLDAANKEILRKLDLILSNQAQIKEELSIIKVRSTHR